MKSIRVSLIVYFLVLLAAAFGTASVLVYRTAIDNLRAKQESDHKWRELEYKEECEKVCKQFDAQLETKAIDVASHTAALVPTRLVSGRSIRILLSVGLMNDPRATLLAPFYSPNRFVIPIIPNNNQIVNPVSDQITVLQARDIGFDEDRFPQSANPAEPIYYQINFSWRRDEWRSASLGGHPVPKSERFAGMDFIPHLDDVELYNKKLVRRVVIKYPTERPRSPGGPPRGGRGDGGRGGRGDGGRGGRGDPPNDQRGRGDPRGGSGIRGTPPGQPSGIRPAEAEVPWIVVQCAMEPTQRDHHLADLKKAYNENLDSLHAEAREALASLRRRLLLLGLCTFLATTIGGTLLVNWGLAPLRRLSEAVSRVTHRDFKLPLATNEKLPSELDPIRARLQETLDELRRAFEREKQASADISHELRTPVASILTAIEVSLKKQRSAAEYRQTLEDCRVSARQMRTLVERLMALARLDAGSDRIRPREVDVGQLVSDCAALVRPLAGERGLALRVHCAKSVTWTTDPDKLREVMINLLHNAIQYNRPAGAIDLSAQADDGWLDVQVHDTGIGIAPEAREHIFERFYRSDPSRSGSELHAGLGLSIVKGYVGLLGGTISVESQPGQGSTFRVRLPAVAQAA